MCHLNDTIYTCRRQEYAVLRAIFLSDRMTHCRNIKVMFDIASLDCESLRMNNEIEVCVFSV